MSIQYDVKNNRVKHKLDYLSNYDLEGEFGKVIKSLEKKFEDEKTYYSTARKVSETNYNGGAYADGTSTKMVTFDKFSIEIGYLDGDHKELQIWGERDILPEENEALIKKALEDKKKHDEYKRAQYEALKKELGE
jgi:hypothetical protein